jgi:hypothetical protein
VAAASLTSDQNHCTYRIQAERSMRDDGARLASWRQSAALLGIDFDECGGRT